MKPKWKRVGLSVAIILSSGPAFVFNSVFLLSSSPASWLGFVSLGLTAVSTTLTGVGFCVLWCGGEFRFRKSRAEWINALLGAAVFFVSLFLLYPEKRSFQWLATLAGTSFLMFSPLVAKALLGSLRSRSFTPP